VLYRREALSVVDLLLWCKVGDMIASRSDAIAQLKLTLYMAHLLRLSPAAGSYIAITRASPPSRLIVTYPSLSLVHQSHLNNFRPQVISHFSDVPVPSIATRQCCYPEISALLPSPALLLVRAILEPNTDSMATVEEAECAYTYEPLEEPDQSIRLLKILSVTPRITCTFKVAHLKDSPVFSCLSYVWGDAAITEPVTVEGKTLHITVNLAGAIRDVHRQWSAGQVLAPGEEQ
jgi:hypothetical protein